MLSCVYLTYGQSTHSSFMQYSWVYLAYPFLLWWWWEYVHFILFSHSNRSMTHLPLFKVRSWNDGMCCMSFYIFMHCPSTCMTLRCNRFRCKTDRLTIENDHFMVGIQIHFFRRFVTLWPQHNGYHLSTASLKCNFCCERIPLGFV